MKAIDNKELILSLEELEKERGIKKDYLLEAIETALVTAYKRNFDSLENVKVNRLEHDMLRADAAGAAGINRAHNEKLDAVDILGKLIGQIGNVRV